MTLPCLREESIPSCLQSVIQATALHNRLITSISNRLTFSSHLNNCNPDIIYLIPATPTRRSDMNIWTIIILSLIIYGLFPGPAKFTIRMLWGILGRLWGDLMDVAQSPAAREFVCQAVRISCAASLTWMRTTGIILMLPGISVQRLWPVANFGHHPPAPSITSSHKCILDSQHLKDMEHSTNTPPGCEEHTVKTVCAGRGKDGACRRVKHMPPGEMYYCTSHISQSTS